MLINSLVRTPTPDTEITVPFVQNPDVTNVLVLKPGVGQRIAIHALLSARKILFQHG